MEYSHRGLDLKIGPFWVNLVSPLSQVSAGLSLLYADYPAGHADGVPDFHIELRPPGLLRAWLRPQTNFYLDGHSPFKPLPKDQAFAMFEWGLNWCVANYAHQYLNIHAAVVERDGMALILPGEPVFVKIVVTFFTQLLLYCRVPRVHRRHAQD